MKCNSLTFDRIKKSPYKKEIKNLEFKGSDLKGILFQSPKKKSQHTHLDLPVSKQFKEDCLNASQELEKQLKKINT